MKSTSLRLLALLLFLGLPVWLLAGRYLDPAGVARGKSAPFPLSEGMTPEQELAQELALEDARVQAYTAGHQSEVFGVLQIMAGQSTPASRACLSADCRQVEIYIFDENAAVMAIVNLDTEEVLDVLYLPGGQPGINRRLAERAMEIAVNAPEVIDALGYRPLNGTMAPVSGGMPGTSCDEGHLCAVTIFETGDGQVLWVAIDLTEDRLAGIVWGEQGPEEPLTAPPSLPQACPEPGSVTRDGWDLQYGVTDNDGLRVHDVTYNGVEVLRSVKIVEWHVDYGSTGFNDVPGCGSGGGGFPIPAYGDTQVLDLLDEQNNVIGFEVVQDFRMANWGQNCNYRYEQRIQFYDDGRFRPVGGAFGKGCDEVSTYRPVVRIDIAVGGDDDDNFGYFDGNDWVDLTIEDFRLPYSDPDFPDNGPHYLTPENYSWRVLDAGGAGYYIEQDLGQFPQVPPGRGDSPFLYATLHRPEEGDTDLPVIGGCCNDDHQQGPHTFVNGENIADENIVIWYVSQSVTDAAPPDYYCWTVSGVPPVETYPCFAGPMFHLSDGEPVQAGFTHDGPKLVGEPVSFSNTTAGTPPIKYVWDFGDGSAPSTEENPTHAYTDDGEYVVTLTARNLWGINVYTDTVTINMAATFGDGGIIAQPGKIVLPGQPITFSSTADGTEPLTYAWDFGDGTTSDEAEPTHAYSAAGEYLVTLTISNEFGSDTAEVTILVVEEHSMYWPVIIRRE